MLQEVCSVQFSSCSFPGNIISVYCPAYIHTACQRVTADLSTAGVPPEVVISAMPLILVSQRRNTVRHFCAMDVAASTSWSTSLCPAQHPWCCQCLPDCVWLLSAGNTICQGVQRMHSHSPVEAVVSAVVYPIRAASIAFITSRACHKESLQAALFQPCAAPVVHLMRRAGVDLLQHLAMYASESLAALSYSVSSNPVHRT